MKEDSKSNMIKQLEDEIIMLKSKICNLEDKISSQEIIIDALITKRKIELKEQKVLGDKEYESVKRIKEESSESDFYKKLPIIGDKLSNSDSNILNEVITAKSFLYETEENDTKNNELDPIKIEFIKQVKNIFVPKNKKQEFKPNFSFRKFVEYAECTYEFSLNNKKVSKAKNPLKMYIEINLDKIVKYILDNINYLSMNQVCSTFFLINSEMDYSHKLVLAHDIILETLNYSKLLYFISALFNNQDLADDTISRTIRRVMYHQYCIDTSIFQDDDVYEYLDTIKSNLCLEEPSESIWNFSVSLICEDTLFTESKYNNQDRSVRAEAIEKGFALRLISHYLDWDFTYNTLLMSNIIPKLEKKPASMLLYYLGILTMDAYKAFGKDPSVLNTFVKIKSFLKSCDDVSITAYLILKQIFQVECHTWFTYNQDYFDINGFKKEYLLNFLLL